MTTLDVPELLKCDYLVGLQNGRIEQQGTPADLLNNSKSRLSKMVDYLVPTELISERRKLMTMRIAEVIEEVIKKWKQYY